MHFRDSPDSLSGLGIPWTIWLNTFAVIYIYIKYIGAVVRMHNREDPGSRITTVSGNSYRLEISYRWFGISCFEIRL